MSEEKTNLYQVKAFIDNVEIVSDYSIYNEALSQYNQYVAGHYSGADIYLLIDGGISCWSNEYSGPWYEEDEEDRDWEIEIDY